VISDYYPPRMWLADIAHATATETQTRKAAAAEMSPHATS